MKGASTEAQFCGDWGKSDDARGVGGASSAARFSGEGRKSDVKSGGRREPAQQHDSEGRGNNDVEGANVGSFQGGRGL